MGELDTMILLVDTGVSDRTISGTMNESALVQRIRYEFGTKFRMFCTILIDSVQLYTS